MDENRGNIIIYRDADNSVQLDVRMEQETVWLTQRQIADLFGVKKAAISKHVSNIFSQGELIPEATVSKMETVQIEGTRTIVRSMDYYNLDMILSIGYRVNSKRAIAFRQWSTKVLKDYLLKGFAVNEKLRRATCRLAPVSANRWTHGPEQGYREHGRDTGCL